MSQRRSQEKAAFIVLNHEKYEEGTKIFILTLDGTEVVNKQKINQSVFRMAAADWVLTGVQFVSEDEIEIDVLENVETMEPTPVRIEIE